MRILMSSVTACFECGFVGVVFVHFHSKFSVDDPSRPEKTVRIAIVFFQTLVALLYSLLRRQSSDYSRPTMNQSHVALSFSLSLG